MHVRTSECVAFVCASWHVLTLNKLAREDDVSVLVANSHAS